MSRSFDYGNILGEKISQVRKSKQLSQEALGRMVGMGKSAISKIENGHIHISAEFASDLLEAMGERIVIQIPGYEESSASLALKAKFISISTSWFAHEHNMTYSQAYRFLLLYKAIDFIEGNYAIEQTLPKTEVVRDMCTICRNNGGNI